MHVEGHAQQKTRVYGCVYYGLLHPAEMPVVLLKGDCLPDYMYISEIKQATISVQVNVFIAQMSTVLHGIEEKTTVFQEVQCVST